MNIKHVDATLHDTLHLHGFEISNNSSLSDSYIFAKPLNFIATRISASLYHCLIGAIGWKMGVANLGAQIMRGGHSLSESED
jgi:hypothetical protein